MAAPLALGLLGTAAATPTILALGKRMGMTSDAAIPTQKFNPALNTFDDGASEQVMSAWYSNKLDNLNKLKDISAAMYAEDNVVPTVDLSNSPVNLSEEDQAFQNATFDLISNGIGSKKSSTIPTKTGSTTGTSVTGSSSNALDPLMGLLGLLALGGGAYYLGKKL